MKESYNPAALRHPAVVWSRLKWRWPLLVWLAAVAAVVYLFYSGARFQIMSGVVDVRRRELAALETARISDILVIPGQRVKAGDIVAQMDTSILDADIALENAGLEVELFDVESERARLQADRLQMERQFARAVQDSDAGLRDMRMRQAADDAELAVLNDELARLQDLLARQLIDAQMLTRIRARQRALQDAAGLYPGAITALEDDLAQSRALREEAQAWIKTYGGLATNAAVAADTPRVRQQHERRALLDLRRRFYALRALGDGTVSLVLHEPGEVVQAGEPIVTLVYDGPVSVTGFLPESNAREVTVGMRAYLTRAVSVDRPMPARVTHLGPEIMGLPGRVSPVANRALRGRRIVLVPEGEFDLLPGEAVSIHLARPFWASLIGRP